MTLTFGDGALCSKKDCPASKPCPTCGAGWEAIETGRYGRVTRLCSLVCVRDHRSHFRYSDKFFWWVETEHGPPRRPVEKMLRHELITEAIRLGIKNPDLYIVRELRPVVASRLRQEAGR
jgi:hypothetical protein